jgi:type I restriction enzyme S subunit
MNAERLLAHFERISEAPDAIARLRQYILDLAVRGKLVEQDPEDEPVEDLLQRIAVEKASRRSTRPRSTPDERVEGWCSIPASWNFVRLDKVCTVIMGSSPPGSTYNKTGDGVPLINGPVEFTPGPFGRTTINQYTTDPSAFCEEGDFLVCVRGSTTGRTNIAAFRACIGRGVAAIQPLFEDKFIRLAIRVRQEAILQMGRGIAFPSISREQLSGLPVPLPPLAEQHRIVAKVDELMALCDQLEAARQLRQQGRERLVAATLQRLNQPAEDPASFRKDASFALQVLPSLTTTPAQIKQLRQTILNLAVRGKLVEQERSADEWCQFLEAIKADQLKALRAKRIKPKVAALSSLSDEMLIENSSRTENVSLASVIVFGPQNGISPPEVSDTSAPKALTLSATTSGVFNPKCFKHISLGAEACEPYWLSSGDLLFQRGNTREYVGMAAVYDGPSQSFVYPDLMIRVRISKQVSLRYVHMVLVSPDLRAYLTSNATGSSETMPKINQEVLLNAPLPLPPLAEQHRIVAKVDELMTLCDQLEQQLSQADQQRRRLLEAVLAEALGGRLPTEEASYAAIA